MSESFYYKRNVGRGAAGGKESIRLRPWDKQPDAVLQNVKAYGQIGGQGGIQHSNCAWPLVNGIGLLIGLSPEAVIALPAMKTMIPTAKVLNEVLNIVNLLS